MDLIEQVKAKAKETPQRVAFPEGDEAPILEAAARAAIEGYAYPVVVGDTAAVTAFLTEAGCPMHQVTVVDPADEALVARIAEEYVAAHPLMSAKSAARTARDPLGLAAMCVATGRADTMVGGLRYTTGDVILQSQVIIGLAQGISTISSVGIWDIPGFEGSEGSLLAHADCAVVAAPTPSELADIAICSADTVSALLGWEPRIEMLSFSTRGSAIHERVDQVVEATNLVRERRPDLLVDGEFQLDTAIDPKTAAKKVKDDSPVAGRANILVFPDLGAGNIGVKLVQRFAHGKAYGPLIQGLARPVGDLSRGATTDEIIGVVAIAVVRSAAQGGVA